MGTRGPLPSRKGRDGGFRCQSPPPCSNDLQSQDVMSSSCQPGRNDPWIHLQTYLLEIMKLAQTDSCCLPPVCPGVTEVGAGGWHIERWPVSSERSQHLTLILFSLQVLIPPGGDKGHFIKNEYFELLALSLTSRKCFPCLVFMLLGIFFYRNSS